MLSKVTKTILGKFEMDNGGWKEIRVIRVNESQGILRNVEVAQKGPLGNKGLVEISKSTVD